MICAIVGTRHHPPANGILAVLPVGQDLELVPEPNNEHTTEEFPNAIAVHLDGRSLLIFITDEIESIFQGFGYSSDEIKAGYWHLGYIPKEIAKDINLDGPIRAKFCIGSGSGPKVEFQL